MRKFIKNLSTINQALPFELDQLQRQFQMLQVEIDRISDNLKVHQTQQQEQRAWMKGNTEELTFNSDEQVGQKLSHQMHSSINKVEVQIEELHKSWVEKFQEITTTNKALCVAKSNSKAEQNKQEQKVLDQLNELRFYLNKLKEK